MSAQYSNQNKHTVNYLVSNQALQEDTNQSDQTVLQVLVLNNTLVLGCAKNENTNTHTYIYT